MNHFLRIIACAILLPVAAFAAAPKLEVGKIAEQPDEWFTSAEGRQIVDNIVTWQNSNGGWWKAYKLTEARAPRTDAEKDAIPEKDRRSSWERTSTFDNKATHSELRILAKAYRMTASKSIAMPSTAALNSFSIPIRKRRLAATLSA